MEALTNGEMLALYTLPFLVAGTLANIFVVQNSRLRNFILVGLAVGLAFVSGVVVWSVFWRDHRMARKEVEPRREPVVRQTPTPERTPQKKREVPEKQPTPAPPEPTPEPGLPIYVSSLDDLSARAKYCVVGEVIAESRDGAKALNVTISEANLSLCNYSAHGPRRVAVKLGVVNAATARGKKAGGILWGPSVTLAERLHPGESFSIPGPVNISIPKRGRVNMADAKFVVKLINVPYDSNREMSYYLSEDAEAQLAQVGRD